MKNKKSRNKIIILSSILVFLIMLIIYLLVFVLDGNNVSNHFDQNTLNNGEVNNVGNSIMGMRNPRSIETKYCTLSYPEEWDSLYRYEINEEDVYSVNLYGLVENKEDQLLFSIQFGEEQNNSIGYLDLEEGKIYVAIVFNEFVPDETWTSEEADLIYGMQEDVNYVFDKLLLNDNFVSK